MSAKINAEKEKFIQWYINFKNASESEKDNWNLARSRNEKLNQLILSIEFEFKIIDARMQSGKTYCLIFDSKKHNSDTITDGLIGENVSAKLDTEQEYYVKGDKRAKVCQIKEKKAKNSNQVPKIIVPSTNWPSLETLRLTLSPNTYANFLKQCHEKKYFVDALVVSINSVNDFSNEDIKLLLKDISEHYPGAFILLNDAPDTDCTMLEECDICYEKTRDFLSKLRLLDERFLKVSARSIIQNEEPKQKSNFESFKKLLQEDVTIEKVADRFLKKSKIFMQSFEDIQKFIMEDRSNINKETANYEMELKKKKQNTNILINKSRYQTKTELEKSFKKIENTENFNKDVLKNNIEPVIDQQMDEFKTSIRKHILDVIKAKNATFENYVSDMCIKDYVNPDEYGRKLKKKIDTCIDKIDNELQIKTDNANKNKSIYSKVLSSTNDFIADTFDSITTSFERFVDQFKDKIIEKYQRFETRIKEVKEELVNCLVKDKNAEIRNSLDKIKQKINAKENSMRILINNHINGIITKIRSKIDENLNSGTITNYLKSPRSVSRSISKEIESQLTELSKGIVSDIGNISTNNLLKKWSKELSEKYKWTHLYQEGNFKVSSIDYINKLYDDLKSDTLYDSEVRFEKNKGVHIELTAGITLGATIGVIAGSAVPGIGNLVGFVIGGAFGALVGVVADKERRRPLISRDYKTIKYDEMINIADGTAESLMDKANAIINDIIKDFDNFIIENQLMT